MSDDTPRVTYDEAYEIVLAQVILHDPESEAATAAMKNLVLLSQTKPDPVPQSDPTPTTRRGRFLAATGKVLDNETTRACIKAAGALAGVVTVTYATIHRDHVLERQAIAQANQKPM